MYYHKPQNIISPPLNCKGLNMHMLMNNLISPKQI